jgi:tetratricopeptide (TPR) repeat protein
VPIYRRESAGVQNNLGSLLVEIGKGAEAEAAYRQALAQRERLAAGFPGVPEYAVDLGDSLSSLGHLFRKRGEPQAALEWYGQAVARLRPVVAAEPRLAAGRHHLGNSHAGRAEVLMTLGRPAEALSDWDRAVELADGPTGDSFRLHRARALARAGEAVRAVAEAEELAAAPGATAAALKECAGVLAVAAAGSPPDADRYHARAVELLRLAFAKGYRDIAAMLQDSDLDPLRRRADYADLLWDLADTPAARR